MRISRRPIGTAFALALLSALLVAACDPGVGPDPRPDSEDEPLHPPGDIPEYFWGTWVRMDRNEKWYFTDGDLLQRVDGDEARVRAGEIDAQTLTSDFGTLERRTENMFAVVPDDSSDLEYYMFRERGPTAEADSTVRSNAAGARTLIGTVAGIQVIISNTLNVEDTQEAVSGSDGEVTFEGLIPGDDYVIAVPQQDGVETAFEVPVTPAFDGQDLGSVTITTAAQNIKAGYDLSDASDFDFLYQGNNYAFALEIKNLGFSDLVDASYELEVPAGLSLTGTPLQGTLGIVRAFGNTRTLDFTLRADTVEGDFEDFTILLSVVTADGLNEWSDSVTVRVFRQPMEVFFRASEDRIQGIVITPERQSFPFSERDDSFIVPERSEPYIIALAGADYTSETAYTVRLGSRPISDGSELVDLDIGEPNDDESVATPAPLGQEITGFLGVGDLDFFRISSVLEDGAAITWNWTNIDDQSNVTAYEGYELTWEPVWSLTYEVQTSGDDPTFSSPRTIAQSSTRYQFDSPDVAGVTTLYARVRGLDAGGATTAWSEPVAFDVWSGAIGGVGPAGGIVFYDRGAFRVENDPVVDGWRYLEAAPADASSGTVWGGWGDTDFDIFDTRIGSGARNTFFLLRWLGDGTYAAALADAYEAGGYGDWYLPAEDELTQLYTQRTPAMNLANSLYWSSSDGGFFASMLEEASAVNFATGAATIVDRNTVARVRAIRVF